jgi:hypothetical protein
MSTRPNKKWKSITVQHVAKAIFGSIKGKVRLLEESHEKETSIWNRVARNLLTSDPTVNDRWVAKQTWKLNKDNIRVRPFVYLICFSKQHSALCLMNYLYSCEFKTKNGISCLFLGRLRQLVYREWH